MRFIFTADLHGNRHQYEKVFAYAADNGIPTIILGGDLTPKDEPSRTPFHQRMFLKEFLFPLIEKNKDKNILLLMGNDDFKSNESFLYESQESVGFHLFDNKSVFLDGIYFVGYSSVPYTPFVWKDWEKRDLESDTGRNLRKETLREGFISQGDDFIKKDIFEDMKRSSIEGDLEKLTLDIPAEKLILVTHAPPNRTCCDYTQRKDGKLAHVGSKAVRKIIEKRQPLLSLHGHIHDTVQNTGVFPDYLNKTVCAAVGNDHLGERPHIIVAKIGNNITLVRERLY